MEKYKYSLFLCIAIAAEITATMLLAYSRGMSSLPPTIMALACYVLAYYFLTLSLKRFPLGLAYALWAGTGIVMSALINYLRFHVTLSTGGFIGITMIIAGVMVINLLAKSERTSAIEGSK
ncbi:DMT family transporter [Kalamiella sp. sgz302252]|uniref:DMT family transporter n=1 Tax=Pantoea sp. sgz302252 TaxID=3341827 RepID=UPI0036D303B8